MLNAFTTGNAVHEPQGAFSLGITIATSVPEMFDELSRLGFSGARAALLDIVPLIEVAWADGEVAAIEEDLVFDFLERHTRRINLAAGYTLIDLSDARQFVEMHLQRQPDPEWFSDVRTIFSRFRSQTHDLDGFKLTTETILATCIDIAASSSRHKNPSARDLVDASEKRALLRIIETFYGG